MPPLLDLLGQLPLAPPPPELLPPELPPPPALLPNFFTLGPFRAHRRANASGAIRARAPLPLSVPPPSLPLPLPPPVAAAALLLKLGAVSRRMQPLLAQWPVQPKRSRLPVSTPASASEASTRGEAGSREGRRVCGGGKQGGLKRCGRLYGSCIRIPSRTLQPCRHWEPNSTPQRPLTRGEQGEEAAGPRRLPSEVHSQKAQVAGCHRWRLPAAWH